MSFLFVVESHAQNVDTFEISVGQTIGADQPVLGSGHIEEEGGQDIYLFEGKAGQTVFLEMLAHEVSFRQMIWTVTGPDGKILALECFRCQDPGYIKLTRTGEHQIVVGELYERPVLVLNGHGDVCWAATALNIAPGPRAALLEVLLADALARVRLERQFDSAAGS